MYQIQTKNKDFYVTSEIEKSIDMELVSCEDGVSVYKVSFALDKEEKIPQIQVKWHEPMLGLLSTWSPNLERDRAVRQWAAPQINTSNFYKGAPLMAFINQNNKNYSTVAVSEGEYNVELRASVNDFEEKEQMDFICTIFGYGEVLKEYAFYIRIDNNRERPYYESIMAVSGWWNVFYPNTNPPTVTGEYPLYSSWYNYHQHPESFTMEKELEIAAEMGFKSVIIDDGWSYDGLGTGDYFDCGSWEVVPSKFPDFKGFVQKAHDMGMKIALWFPVPFLGYNDPEFEKYRDKMLYLSTTFIGAPIRAGVLDPRYKETRAYIVDSYLKIVEKYDLDGLKLDFIDHFQCMYPELIGKDCGGAPDKDFESVEDGAIKLLEEIREAFTATRPDFMIEFRQRYFGPSITRYCNMLRVGDCPFDLIKNRLGVVDLRLFNYNLAVHSDMLYWAKDESTENCALQLLNILFSVPQISVLLTQSNEEQKTLIKNHIAYWAENRKLILHGEFKPLNPEYNYTFVSSEGENKRVAVSYLGNAYTFDGKATDLFNGAEKQEYFIDNASEKRAKIALWDCLGNKISESFVEPNSVVKIKVPTAGKMEIR